MAFEPGYGETPLDFDELDALQPELRELLGDPIQKSQVYDLEQAIQEEVAEELLFAALEGGISLDQILTDRFLRELHLRLYGDIWTWGGHYRTRTLNIGVDHFLVSSEVRASFENISYRWEHTNDWTPRQLGAAVHAEIVRIHPFFDGNGRSTRLLADLVLAAAHDGSDPEQFDWQLDRGRYIELLREFDHHRDARFLAEFIQARQFGG